MSIEVEERDAVILHLRAKQPEGSHTIRQMFTVADSLGP
jgi:hypothetical protein